MKVNSLRLGQHITFLTVLLGSQQPRLIEETVAGSVTKLFLCWVFDLCDLLFFVLNKRTSWWVFYVVQECLLLSPYRVHH